MHTPSLSTKHFDWDGKSKTISQEASTLALAPLQSPTYIDLFSHRTGNVMRFKKSQTELSDSGEDIYAWHYTPLTNTDRNMVSELIIWND